MANFECGIKLGNQIKQLEVLWRGNFEIMSDALNVVGILAIDK